MIFHFHILLARARSSMGESGALRRVLRETGDVRRSGLEEEKEMCPDLMRTAKDATAVPNARRTLWTQKGNRSCRMCARSPSATG